MGKTMVEEMLQTPLIYQLHQIVITMVPLILIISLNRRMIIPCNLNLALSQQTCAVQSRCMSLNMILL